MNHIQAFWLNVCRSGLFALSTSGSAPPLLKSHGCSKFAGVSIVTAKAGLGREHAFFGSRMSHEAKLAVQLTPSVLRVLPLVFGFAHSHGWRGLCVFASSGYCSGSRIRSIQQSTNNCRFRLEQTLWGCLVNRAE